MHDEARKLYDSGMSLADIAAKLETKPATVRSWKAREQWPEHERPQRNATEKSNVASKAVESVISNTSLTAKQQLFCLHYSRSFNATKSYQKAYECSYESALRAGPELLRNLVIRDEINKLKEQRYSQAMLKPEDIFQKYMDIAFADMTDFLSWGQEEVAVDAYTDPDTGEHKTVTQMRNTVNFHESTNVDGSILSEVKQGKDGASIKLADRMKALDWLTEHMNMATEEQTAKLGLIQAQTKKLNEDEDVSSNDDGVVIVLGRRKDSLST